MTASGRCPACGGELRVATRHGATFRRCLACHTTVVDAALFDRLLPPETPPGPQYDGYPGPEPQPQQDHGHGAGRPRPPFAPPWSASGPDRPDGSDLMFGP